MKGTAAPLLRFLTASFVAGALAASIVVSHCAKSELRNSPPQPLYPVLTPQQLVGCYGLQISTWNPPIGSDPEGFYQPPREFELTHTEIPNTLPQAYKIVAHVPDPTHAFHAAWQIDTSNEATLSWSTGFVGVSAKVRRQRRTGALVGTAQTFTDVSPFRGSTATFIARRKVC